MDALISDLRESGALKRDGRRVSLEGVLTGAALGLFLVYMLDDLAAPAEAQPLEGGAGSQGPARLPGHGQALGVPGSRGADDDGAGASRLPRMDGPAGLAGAGGLGGPAAPFSDASDGNGAARAGLLPDVARPESLDLDQVAGLVGSFASGSSTGELVSSLDGGFGGGYGGGGFAGGGFNGGRLSGAGFGGLQGSGDVEGLIGGSGLIQADLSPQSELEGAWLGSVPGSELATGSLNMGGGGGRPGPGGGEDGGHGGGTAPPPPPPPKVLLVQVQSLIGAEGLSLDGLADATATVRQVGLENTVLDMRGSDADVLAVLSEGVVPVAARSPLDAATLEAITEQVAMLDSSVITSDTTSVVVIQAAELLELALEAGTQATADVESQVAALSGSELTALHADELVALQAQTELQFEALGEPEQVAITVELLNQALNNSVVLLGDGDTTVVIDSVIDGTLSLPALDVLPGELNLNAQAVGLDGSRLEAGAGDDLVLIRSYVDLVVDNLPEQDDLLADDLADAELDQADPDAPVVLAPLPLAATVMTEAIALRNSQVNLGAGNDQLLLQGANHDASVDGGSGMDLLMLAPPAAAALEVVVQDSNTFSIGTLDVLSVETLLLGDGDDHVTLNQPGYLDGLLVGGNGIDILDYSTRTEAVLVDLERGIATDIGAGQSGALGDFEGVIGSQADDQLFVSSAAASVDGGGGDDQIYLRWAPWMAPSDSGVLISGGTGQDLFVLAGLDEPAPADWDGVSGLPVFTDLDILWPSTSDASVLEESSALEDLSASSAPALPVQTETTLSPAAVAPAGSSTSLLVGLGLVDRFAISYSVFDSSGRRSQRIRELTPSGVEGIGDAKMLPIAPTDQILSGTSTTLPATSAPQLAIGLDDDEGASLYQVSGVSGSSETGLGSGVSSLRRIASIRRS